MLPETNNVLLFHCGATYRSLYALNGYQATKQLLIYAPGNRTGYAKMEEQN
jgi:hypothetical protein